MNHSRIIEQYRKWILMQRSENYTISENELGNIELETRYVFGYVNFYEQAIIELRIDRIQDGETEFFLHFQLNDLDRAKEMFNEMTEALINLKKSHQKQILLCCTSGLTTSYFAEQLNHACETMNYQIHFSAVSYTQVYRKGDQYEAILLAPQISYERNNMEKVLKDQLVMSIPAKIFAKYDCGAMLDLLNKELNLHEEKKTTKAERTRSFFNTTEKILTIGVINDHDETCIQYRYYKEGDIVLSGENKNKRFDVKDILYILDFVLKANPEISIVGIGVPGTVTDGVVYLPNNQNRATALKDIIQQKYHVSVYIFNDANMLATGVYWLEDRYRSLITYFQPQGYFPGAGVVVNGHLVKGKNSIAGEIGLLRKVLNLKTNFEEILETPAGMIELQAKVLVAMIVTIGPEAVFVYNEMVPDVELLKEELKKYIPEPYLPDIVQMADVREYMMTGIFLRSIWSVLDKKRNFAGLHTF